ncbi:MAG: D-tyrosyl-tRNA(Tyr) deacylase [Gammaproteobacteria bacterium]|nr:D-tyrosyl-tRNA(Tyr) deacylase [Gammaproteobacteria bacterium]
MIALLQRVREASIRVDGALVASIGPGLLVFVGVEKDDTAREARRLAERVLSYRVFADDRDRMNLSLQDIGGELLLVPQFTLAADTNSGNRPSFSTAAEPARATALFETLTAVCRERPLRIGTGVFGADMQVGLINDGPVTFSLRVPPCRPGP